MAKSIDYKTHGFEIWHTGGGCMAWRKVYETGCYALITDDGGCSLPDHDADAVALGLFDYETGEELDGNAWACITGEQALEMAERYAAQYVREE